MWVQFELREDLLRDIKVGTRIHVRVPRCMTGSSISRCA
jgi:hypothetical protein